MIETYFTLVLFLLLPIEITAEPVEWDKEAFQEVTIQIEQDTRAWRQKKSGRGL